MLTNKEIKRQIDLGNIEIENAGPNFLRKPNSCDLRIGNTLYVFDYTIVDSKNGTSYLEEVLNDKPKLLRKITIPETGLILEPNKVYLTKTVEKVKTHGFIPVMHGRTNFSLLGLSIELTSGYKYNGFDGHFLLSIIATKPTVIYPDISIANLTFFPSLDETTKGYQSGMLSGEEIKRRMQMTNPDIIIDKPDKIVINPNSVNLTLNEVVGVYSEPVLDIKEKNPVEMVEIGEDGMIFYPGEIYLGRTNEWTETQNLVPMMSGRSSLGRNGFHVHCSAGMGSLGYKGYWHMGIRPVLPILVKKDMKCCQIYYFTAEGEIADTYNGSMQNLPKDVLDSQIYKSLKRTRK